MKTIEAGQTTELNGTGAALALPEAEGGKLSYSLRLEAVIADLSTMQATCGQAGKALSDAQFAKDFLGGYSYSTWNRLKNHVYPVTKAAAEWNEKCDELAEKFEGMLREARIKLMATAKLRQRVLAPIAIFRAMLQAVRVAAATPGDNRLVVYPAPTGGGKTSVLRFIGEQVSPMTVVEAKPSWNQSYADALKDICRELRISYGLSWSRGTLENTIIAELNKKDGHVLAIDEANYFSSHTIDLVKMLLNKTRAVVVLCCTETHFRRMREHWEEWVQLERRINALVEWSLVLSEDVKELAGPLAFTDAPQCCKLIAKAANEQGAFDTVQRVLDELSRKVEAEPAGYTPGQVAEAIALATKIQGKGWTPRKI